MTDFRDYKTASRFSFAINAGWSARLDGKPVTSMGPAQTKDPDLELAAYAYGWTRCDETEKEAEAKRLAEFHVRRDFGRGMHYHQNQFRAS